MGKGKGNTSVGGKGKGKVKGKATAGATYRRAKKQKRPAGEDIWDKDDWDWNLKARVIDVTVGMSARAAGIAKNMLPKVAPHLAKVLVAARYPIWVQPRNPNGTLNHNTMHMWKVLGPNKEGVQVARFCNKKNRGHWAAIPHSLLDKDKFVTLSDHPINSDPAVSDTLAGVGVVFHGTPPAQAPKPPRNLVTNRVDMWLHDNSGKHPELADIPLEPGYMEALDTTGMVDMELLLETCPVGMDMEPDMGPLLKAGLKWTARKNVNRASGLVQVSMDGVGGVKHDGGCLYNFIHMLTMVM